jgi:hypothetical protein
MFRIPSVLAGAMAAAASVTVAPLLLSHDRESNEARP